MGGFWDLEDRVIKGRWWRSARDFQIHRALYLGGPLVAAFVTALLEHPLLGAAACPEHWEQGCSRGGRRLLCSEAKSFE